MAVSIAQGFGFEKEWLEDALYNIEDKPGVFLNSNNDEAQSIFGIGKNKVEALYTWLKAMDFVEDFEEGHRLTSLGCLVKQYDQYFKREGTWWVIHILLSRSKANVDLWYYFSNFWHSEKVFDRKTLFDFFKQKCTLASERSIKNGMNAVLTSIIDTPLTTLGVLSKIGKDELIRKVPDIRALHPSIVAFAIIKWAKDYNVDTIALQDLSDAIDSVGRVLFLNQYNIMIYLERIADMYDRKVLSFNKAAGYNIVEVKIKEPNKILEAYYLEVVNKIKPYEAIKSLL